MNAGVNGFHQVMRHPQYQNVWDRIARCHRSVARRGYPENLRLVGVSGVGKSTLLINYRDAHPSVFHPEYTEVPVVYAEVPAMPTSKQLAINLLKGLGCADTTGTASQLWDRFAALCRRCCVGLIILDEIQHFVDRGKLSTYSSIADLLKQHLSDLKLPVVMAGAPRCRLLFEANNQLRSRFKASTSFYPFRIGTVADFQRFRTVVSTVVQDFDETARRFLVSDNMVERIFYATDGIFRNLTDLMDGVRVSRMEGMPCTAEVLAKAFQETVFACADQASNPFAAKFQPRRLIEVGEPYMPSPIDGDNHAIY